MEKTKDLAAEEMCHILSKNRWLHRIKEDIGRILIKLEIITNKKVIEIKVHKRFEPQCFVSCAVKAENNIFGKDINIMIKPDLGKKHRILREVVQENSNIEMEAEDMDDERSRTITIFVRELEKLEKDIERALANFKQREKAA